MLPKVSCFTLFKQLTRFRRGIDHPPGQALQRGEFLPDRAQQAGSVAVDRAQLRQIERDVFSVGRERGSYALDEFVGHVFDEGFEIWERQQRAIHLIGIVRAKRGGTRIDLRYVLAPVTRVVTVVFFGLYFIGTIGLSMRDPEPAVSVTEILAIVAGAGVLAAGFVYFARRQRADLAAFVARVFADATRAG